jgi:hypothetical protein
MLCKMNIDPSSFDDMSNVRPTNNCVSFANLFLFEFDAADAAMRSSPNRILTDPSIMSSIELLEKKRVNSSPQESDCTAAICKTHKKQRTVSFAPDYELIQLDDDQPTEDIKSLLWYSRYDFMVFENEACLCSEAVRESASQGSFDNELDNILGLEKIIFCDSFYEYRHALRMAVMEEQAVQQLTKEIRTQLGCFEPDGLMQLANTSERYSLWAREQASLYAFTLEHDLGTDRAEVSSE